MTKRKLVKRRLCVKQVWYDRHTRWTEEGRARLIPFSNEVPF